jgi:hypothetical protein
VRRLLPLALLALGACIDDLEPQYRVTDLRILAVRAEVEGTGWADAVPGDRVRLEALLANPLGRAPVEVAWYGCWPDLGGGRLPTDAFLPCLDEAVLRDPDALASAPGVFSMGTGATVTWDVPGPSDPAVAAVLASLGQVPPAYACRLYLELGVVTVVRSGDRREIAVKRLRVTPATSDPEPGYVRNANPAIGDVLRASSEEGCASGAPVEDPPFPAARTFLCGFSGLDAAQEVNLCGPDGVIGRDAESLTWQWYVTAGEFPEVGGVGNATGDSPEFEATAAPFTLWVILRDGRGGVAWETYPGVAPSAAGYPPDGTALPAPEPMSVFRSSSVK